MTILLHEYAHHFLISSQRSAMPKWVSEGAAQFFASAAFEGDGSVKIGRPNGSRGFELTYAVRVPSVICLTRSFTPRTPESGTMRSTAEAGCSITT